MSVLHISQSIFIISKHIPNITDQRELHACQGNDNIGHNIYR
jgi:hypothetical protein